MSRMREKAADRRARPQRRSVLVVASSELLRRSISRILARVPFDVSAAGSPAEGLARAEADAPDLVVVECGAATSTPTYIEALRSAGGAPVVLVGEDASEGIRYLEAGLADDYVQSPIWERELRARAVQHASGAPHAGILDFGELVVDLLARTVHVRDSSVQLTPREFDLLAYLATHLGSVFTKDELLEQVWGSSPRWQRAATVNEHVYRLRRKLEADPLAPRWIVTLPRSGYYFGSGGNVRRRAVATGGHG